MKKRTALSITSLLVAIGCATAEVNTQQSAAAANDIPDVRVKVTTTKGVIEGILFASKTPLTVANFVNLSKRKYYDGIIFHRVIPEFMAQVGDPLTKKPGTKSQWGTGGPGYTFADEFRSDLRHDRPGVFSMANAGRGTNGSQIFITHVPTPHLDGKHTVFGHVTKGQQILNALTVGDKIVEVEILDNTDALLKAQAKQVAEWNAILDQQ